MRIIVGLGNPGDYYRGTRHNIGFSVARALAKAYKIPLKNCSATHSLNGSGSIGRRNITIALPLTFMNLSGITVKALVAKYKIDLADLLVICDDMDLGFGQLRIKPCGSSAGHRGLKSIIGSLGSQDFCRLRVGIGAGEKQDAASFVLSPFNKEENKCMKQVVEDACACSESWVKDGIDRSMNLYNRRDS
ncbi:MAG: aminoacyl-tRNA hydrolase [Candidatus Omnitrophota bacterium]